MAEHFFYLLFAVTAKHFLILFAFVSLLQLKISIFESFSFQENILFDIRKINEKITFKV